MDINGYEYFQQKYKGLSTIERSHFAAVCSFFELSDVFMNRGLLGFDIYFDIFNPGHFWHKVKPIIEGMRKKKTFYLQEL